MAIMPGVDNMNVDVTVKITTESRLPSRPMKGRRIPSRMLAAAIISVTPMMSEVVWIEKKVIHPAHERAMLQVDHNLPALSRREFEGPDPEHDGTQAERADET